MDDALLGLHHVTAIAGDAQRNLDFYAGTLGLRLVKHTVNFDDPSTLHLYYGDGLGTPGSIVTFFAWPGGRRGRQGTGQAAVVSLAIAPESIGYWIARLIERGVAYEGPLGRFGAAALALRDLDGLPEQGEQLVLLVAHDPDQDTGNEQGLEDLLDQLGQRLRTTRVAQDHIVTRCDG